MVRWDEFLGGWNRLGRVTAGKHTRICEAHDLLVKAGSARREERVECLCGLGLHAREHVGVGVERDPDDARVPEAL